MFCLLGICGIVTHSFWGTQYTQVFKSNAQFFYKNAHNYVLSRIYRNVSDILPHVKQLLWSYIHYVKHCNFPTVLLLFNFKKFK